MNEMMEKCFMELMISAFDQLVREEDLPPDEKKRLVQRLGTEWFQAKRFEEARKSLLSYLNHHRQEKDRIFYMVQSAFFLLCDYIPLILLNRQDPPLATDELLPEKEELQIRLRMMYMYSLLEGSLNFHNEQLLVSNPDNKKLPNSEQPGIAPLLRHLQS